MRSILIGLVACVGLAAGAVSAGAMGSPSIRNCAAVATPTGLTSKVQATNVGCTTARKVAKTFALHGKVKGWKCSAKPFEGGASATCKRTILGKHQKVRFQIAD
jgi:hypothetical protein